MLLLLFNLLLFDDVLILPKVVGLAFLNSSPTGLAGSGDFMTGFVLALLSAPLPNLLAKLARPLTPFVLLTVGFLSTPVDAGLLFDRLVNMEASGLLTRTG